MNLTLTVDDLNQLLAHLQKSPQDMFLIDFARAYVARRRYLEAKAQSSIRIAKDATNLVSGTIDHNLGGLESFAAGPRTNRLIRPLYAIDRVFFGAANLKALCVGPRTEMELLSLVGQGFNPDNVRGLDIISYSPWVDMGDMHAMPYPDNAFDVLIAGWVLAYSSDPHKACREFLRVSRDRGIIAVGATQLSAERRAAENRDEKTEGLTKVDDILAAFGHAVRNVYVRHESESEDEEGRTIVIFDVNK